MIPQAIHREGEADEGFELGERLLYLRTPYFRAKTSNSCKQLSVRLVLHAAA